MTHQLKVTATKSDDLSSVAEMDIVKERLDPHKLFSGLHT